MFVLGIDVGTGGARAVVCDSQGTVIAQADEPFPHETAPSLPPGWFEQEPGTWWAATVTCLRRVTYLLKDAGHDVAAIVGVSVTSTSGTVCTIGKEGEPLGPALMYNDGRAEAEAETLHLVGKELEERLGYRFAPSFALAKILWLQKHEPQRSQATHLFLSPTDFIIGRLTCEYGITDYTNALKTGYDLIGDAWPDFIQVSLGIPLERLPRVAPPGTMVATVSRQAAEQTGLVAGTRVLAGMTDGCASQVSTGAVAPGQWNSTLGTTLVIKGVTRALIQDPAGRVYCHRHPDGYWLPGGASNTGGDGISRRFAASRLDALNAQSLHCAPTGLIVYPLARLGERFPFAHPQAQGFVLGEASDEATLYTAHLEGVGYVERLAYDVLASLGAEVGDEVYVAGGATSSSAWLQLRSDILGKALKVPAAGSGAKGAAIVAASGTLYDGIVPAARAMVRITSQVEPRPAMRAPYDDRYQRFCAACRERGYIG
ncbi:MAG: FGGY-family carbohydrate kinase [Anaerolineae bacterium]|nr:FGGY-family carbohydrate kinase [Anaerolineae bacterium]